MEGFIAIFLMVLIFFLAYSQNKYSEFLLGAVIIFLIMTSCAAKKENLLQRYEANSCREIEEGGVKKLLCAFVCEKKYKTERITDEGIICVKETSDDFFGGIDAL